MVVQEMNKNNDIMLKQLEDEFKIKIKDLMEDEGQLKAEIDLISKYTTKLEREKADECTQRSKLEEELMLNNKSREEEVQLRIKFESKLNNMHFINRDLNSKYKRALLDIETLQNTNELLNNKKIESVELQNQLKMENLEQTILIRHDKSKISTLERENTALSQQISELLDKTAEMQGKLDRLQYHNQTSLKQISEQKLTIDANISHIQALKSEKAHLKQNENEARSFKKLFEQKYREASDDLK